MPNTGSPSSTVRPALIALALMASALGACTEDPLFPSEPIQVTAVDMPRLEGDAVYELWLSYPHELAIKKDPSAAHNLPEYFSAGRFVVAADGSLQSPSGGPAAFTIGAGRNPSLVGEAIVTVEPRNDNDTVPDAVMLSGAFVGSTTRGHAILETKGPRAFDSVALALRQGRFVLEALTSADPADALNGLWFLVHQPNQTTGDSLTPGLSLPTQPLNHDNDRWVYEAWLTMNTSAGTTYRSLGRFRNPAAADDNGAGPGAGAVQSGALRFPGEDFVTGADARRLNDSTYGVIVSLQPEDLALAAPLVRLLERPMIPADARPREPIVMSQTARLPLIEVTIER